jgi:hypothetical protein
MSNSVYNITRREFVTATFDWLGEDICLVALSGTPAFVAGHEQLGDIITAGAVKRGVSNNALNKSIATDGGCRSDPLVIPSLSIGADITHAVLVKRHPTVENDSQLIMFIDDAWELPYVPNGLDIPFQPDWAQDRSWFRG